MCKQRLQNLFDEQQVRYETLTHEPTYTAYRLAARAHAPAQEVAKIVIVAINGRLAMVVLPASEMLDLDKLKTFCGAHDVRIASEDDYKIAFPDCELGAMPPFGNLYDMHVFVAETLRDDEQIIFNAGTHTELMRVSYCDYEKLVQPSVASISITEADH